jgi:SIR2-like domain
MSPATSSVPKGGSVGRATLIVVDAGPGDTLPLDLIADAVRKRECILFLGAGVHAPPPEGSSYDWPLEHRPALGADLSCELAKQCGLAKRYPQEDPRNLARVATFFENQFSRHQLVQVIAQRVQHGREASPMLLALAQLDFPLVITTNQENLFEAALFKVGKHPRPAVYSPESREAEDPPHPTAESPIIYKLHGDTGRPGTMVVTDEDLMRFTMRMTEKDGYNPVPITLKYHLMRWTTLFVGYSLRDYNMRLLLTTLRWNIDRANMPDMYSVDLSPDPLVLEVWENRRRYLKFLAENVWVFVPKLYERVLGKELLQ